MQKINKEEKIELASIKLKEKVVEGIQKKKGHDIVILDMAQIENAVCRYFIVCHGDSNIQVTAIAESIEEHVKTSLHETILHREGYKNAQWILLDYGDVVVHVFQKPYREFYNLEALWADAERNDIVEKLNI